MDGMKRLACLFPGIGYTCDKPLLYYSRKLLKELGWETIPVSYTGFPDQVRDDPEKKLQCVRIAMAQAEEALEKIDWKQYEDILFIGKSVGTVVGAMYAKQRGIRSRQVLFTPVDTTFEYAGEKSIVFHGTADPWAETDMIRDNCRKQGFLLYETEGANHSLETGDTDKDIRELRNVMKLVRYFITGETEK